jgi:4-amino-4-deoxy-L-arabinose transferase-like glycosyltransferase
VRKWHHRRMETSALSKLQDYWALLDQARKETLEHYKDAVIGLPKDGITLTEYINHYKISRNTGKNQLKTLVKNGKLNLVKAFVPDATNRVRVVNVYVPIKRRKGECGSVTSLKTAMKAHGTALRVVAR